MSVRLSGCLFVRPPACSGREDYLPRLRERKIAREVIRTPAAYRYYLPTDQLHTGRLRYLPVCSCCGLPPSFNHCESIHSEFLHCGLIHLRAKPFTYSLIIDCLDIISTSYFSSVHQKFSGQVFSPIY